MVKPLKGVVVGTEEHHFSSKEAVRKWVRDGGGDIEQRKKALL